MSINISNIVETLQNFIVCLSELYEMKNPFNWIVLNAYIFLSKYILVHLRMMIDYLWVEFGGLINLLRDEKSIT